MRYNKNRIKEIDQSIAFYKRLFKLYMDRIEKLRMIYLPKGYSTGISYNDFDNVQCSMKDVDILEVIKDVKDTEEDLKNTKILIKNYEEEKEIVNERIKNIKAITSDNIKVKEKIKKLSQLGLSKTDIAEFAETSYRYVIKVI